MIRNKGKYRRQGIQSYCKNIANGTRPPGYDAIIGDLMEEKDFHIDLEVPDTLDMGILFERLERFGVRDGRVDFSDKHVSEGLKMCWRVFAKPQGISKVEPLSLDEVRDHLKLEKSAGTISPGRSKGKAIRSILSRAEKIVKGEKAPLPCLAAVRVSLKRRELEDKSIEWYAEPRLVWAYSGDMTAVEGKFAIQLIEIFKRMKTPMAIGYSTADLGCVVDSRVLATGEEVYGTDYSKYDSTIPAKVIRYCFDVLETWFDLSDPDARRAWEIIREYFIYTPIVMHDGCLYTGKNHGIPSGSYFTQIIGSMVNTVIMGTISSKFGLKLTGLNFLCLGDDVLFSAYKGLDLVAVSDFCLQTFGILIHTIKSVVGIPFFLGRGWWNTQPFANEVADLVRSATLPERYRKYEGDNYSEKKRDACGVLLSYYTNYNNANVILPRKKELCGMKTPAMFRKVYRSGATKEAHMSGVDKFIHSYGLKDRNYSSDIILQSLR